MARKARQNVSVIAQIPLSIHRRLNLGASDACKHTYSRDSITMYIKGSASKTQVQCPVSGCSKIIELDALRDDEQLERRVQARIRRETEKETQQQGAYTEIVDEE